MQNPMHVLTAQYADETELLIGCTKFESTSERACSFVGLQKRGKQRTEERGSQGALVRSIAVWQLCCCVSE